MSASAANSPRLESPKRIANGDRSGSSLPSVSGGETSSDRDRLACDASAVLGTGRRRAGASAAIALLLLLYGMDVDVPSIVASVKLRQPLASRWSGAGAAKQLPASLAAYSVSTSTSSAPLPAGRPAATTVTAAGSATRPPAGNASAREPAAEPAEAAAAQAPSITTSTTTSVLPTSTATTIVRTRTQTTAVKVLTTTIPTAAAVTTATTTAMAAAASVAAAVLAVSAAHGGQPVATNQDGGAQRTTQTSLDPAAKAQPSLLLFVGVFTAPSAAGKRTEARESWMQHSFISSKQPSIVVRFVVGVPDAGNPGIAAVERERALFGDFLELDMHDSYKNLPQKTAVFFRWCAENKPAAYIAKLDDDVYPALDELMKYVTFGRRSLLSYMGNLLPHNEVFRTGRWAETIYPGTVYPMYANGPGYILSLTLAEAIYEAKLLNYLVSNEDAMVGIWTQVINASRRVEYVKLAAEGGGCKVGSILHMNLNMGHIRCMWARELKGEADICCNHFLPKWEDRMKISSNATSSVNLLDKLQALGLRFYIHDLPALLNRDLLDCYKESQNRQIWDDSGKEKDQNIADVWIHKLLEVHPLRTLDPAMATFFYLPFYGFLSAIFHGQQDKPKCKGRGHDIRTAYLATWLRRSEIFWRNPRAHVLTVSFWPVACRPMQETWALPPCVVTGPLYQLLRCSTLLVYEPLFQSMKDPREYLKWSGPTVTIPYVASKAIVDKMRWVSDDTGHHSTCRVYFRGNLQLAGKIWDTGEKLRHRLLEIFSSAVPSSCFSPSSGKAFSVWDYVKGLQDATFCLVPRGDTPTSRRLFDTIGAGCIPVIVAENMSVPFTRVVDWSKISLQLLESDVWDHPQETVSSIMNIAQEQIATMQRSLANAAQNFVYGYGSPWEFVAGGAIENVLLEVVISLRERRTCTPD